MSQYHNLGTADLHAAARRRDLLAEAERDRLAASVRRPFLAGGLIAALARIPTLQPRRGDALVPAPRSAAAA